jgi:hypothetical protein
MADLADVEAAIVDRVVDTLYPLGVSEGSAVGATCRVYRGWPSPAGLNTDLAAGIANISIYPATTPDEMLVSYLDVNYPTILPDNLAFSVDGRSLTLSGVVANSHSVGLLVDGIPYLCDINQRDTVQIVMANIAAAIRIDRAVTLDGASITIPGLKTLSARLITKATVSRGLRRQAKEIQVSCWCPSPVLRDSISQAVDIGMTAATFLDLSDGTKARVRYVSTQVYDQSQNALLYRRDICFRCEYTIIEITAAPIMVFGDLVTNSRNSLI